jgi:hypothetical protein
MTPTPDAVEGYVASKVSATITGYPAFDAGYLGGLPTV